MEVHIRNFGCVEHLSANFEPGVHLITGPRGCGRTTLCRSIQWALAGSPPGQEMWSPRETSVELVFPGIGVVKRKANPGGETVSFIDKEGVESKNPEESLRKNGIFPEIYHKGAACLYSAYPKEPPATIRIADRTIPILPMSLPDIKIKFHQTQQKRLDIKIEMEMQDMMKSRVAEEIKLLRAELCRLKEQEQTQDDFALYHLMESGECPLYQVRCSCKDGNMAKVKDDVKSRLTGKIDVPGFQGTLSSTERALAEKELQFSILSEKGRDNPGNSLPEKLKLVESQLEVGRAMIDALEKREFWKARMDEIKLLRALKNPILVASVKLRIDLSFRDGFLLDDRPIERLSRSETVVLDYCIQKATGAPVIVVDNFDDLDAVWKLRHIKDAAISGKTVLFTSAASMTRVVSGTTPWHFINGMLEPVAKQTAAR
jgi:AAA domain